MTVPTLLCFAEFLVRSFKAPKSVVNALASVKGFHLLQGFDTAAFDDTRVAHFRRSLPLTMRHELAPARALPLQLLNKLCIRAQGAGQAGLVFGTFLSVLFFSMARASSLLPSYSGRFDPTRLPTLDDVREEGDGCSLLLKWGKTAQDRTQQFRVPLLPVGGSPACPTTLLRGLRASLQDGGPDTPLFSFSDRVGKGRGGTRSLDLRLARAWLALFLELLGEPKHAYTLHSFRRGACTLGFLRGASVTDLQQLGGWRSQAVQLYFPAMEARGRAAALLSSTSHANTN